MLDRLLGPEGNAVRTVTVQLCPQLENLPPSTAETLIRAAQADPATANWIAELRDYYEQQDACRAG